MEGKMLNQFISGRSLVAGVGLLATFLLPAFAWADGFYADLHGGATFFNNDAARVTALTSGGSVHAHTNYDTVGSLAPRPVTNGNKASLANLSSPSVRIT